MSAGNTVSRAAALDLVDIGLKLKCLSHQTLRALGWDSIRTNETNARITESLFLDLWRELADKGQHLGIGLTIGRTINPEAKGLLASWVSQCENLREALSIFRTNIALMNPSEEITLIEKQGVARICFSLSSNPAYPDIAIERSMSALVTWASLLSGKALLVKKASFSFSPPSYLDMYHSTFGANVSFNQDQNALYLDAKFLELPIVSQNPLLKRVVAQQAIRELSEISKTVSTRRRVAELIQTELQAGYVIDIQTLSGRLAMSRQTLYRQLKAEGTDFKSLLDEARKEEALKLLHRGKGITTISLTLGYKDASSFYKAFQRWFGISPKSYLGTIK